MSVALPNDVVRAKVIALRATFRNSLISGEVSDMNVQGTASSSFLCSLRSVAKSSGCHPSAVQIHQVAIRRLQGG